MAITYNDEKVLRLVADGVLSPRCRAFTLELKAGGVAVLTQEVYVTGEEFDALAQLMPVAEQHTTVVHEREPGCTIDVTSLGADWKGKTR